MIDYRAHRFASINFGLLLFFALNPYIRWFFAQGIVQIVFFITTLLAIIRGNYRCIYEKKKIVFSIILYVVYFTLPVVHQFKSGYFLYYLVFLQILFFDSEVYFDGYLVLKKLMVIVCVASLIVWLIHLMGFHLPYYGMSPEWRTENLKDNYHIYGLCISLYRGTHLLGGGLERVCGVFAEPGHFGIYLGLILAVEKFELFSKENVIMLVTGILTFSTAFYGIFCLGMFYRLAGEDRCLSDVRKLFMLMVLLLPFVISNKMFYETAVGRVANYQKEDNFSIISMVDSRTSETTRRDFLRFSYSKKLLTGYGSVDKTEMIGTNWRGLVYRYGIIGCVIITVLVFYLTRGVSFRYQVLLFLIALLIISHRSYLMYAPGIYMMLYVGNMIYGRSEKIVSNGIIS